MVLEEIAEVIYAPAKALKKVIENPKYLAAIVVLILFIGLQFGYEYVQLSKTYVENTSPLIGELPMFTNATLWNNGTAVVLNNNYGDYFNYTVYAGTYGFYDLFTNYTNVPGPSSLEINATNSVNASAVLGSPVLGDPGNVVNVSCGADGFQNISAALKLVSPDSVPQNASLTLYSFGYSDSYTHDLTSYLSNSSLIGEWENLTIPVGPSASGWTSSGSPTWDNITSLSLEFNYPSASNISVRVGALFFRGQYESPVQSAGLNIVISTLEEFSLQFVLTWLLVTGIIYLFFKGFKATILWKPLFVAVGLALTVMVIRALINFVAAFTLPTTYYPFDVAFGTGSNVLGAISYPSQYIGLLNMQSQSAANAIISATSGFGDLVLALFVVSYVWLGYLCYLIVSQLNPAFSMTKRISIAGVSVGITIFLLLFFTIPI